MYPDWDPGMAQNRGGSGRHMDTPNLSAGLLGPIPSSQSQSAGGMPSSWGGEPSSGYSNRMQHSGHSKILSRVVVAKYDRKPISKGPLFALTEPFGTLREHLVLNSKAFLEMDSHQEAVEMVNYYKKHPAKLNGRQITLYLSKELLVIEKKNSGAPPRAQSFRDDKAQGNQVVYFSNLPREEDKKMELLTIAGRFGTVEKHLFLHTEAFVQLGTQNDAEMMVKYYSLNPLDIHGRPIRLNICTKYKTLNVNQKKGNSYRGDNRSRRSDGDNSTSSKSSSSKNTSSKSREERRKSESKQQNVEKKNKEKEEEEEEEEEAVQVLEGDKEAEEEEERSSAPEEEEESKQLPKDVQKPSGEELPDPDSAPDGKDVTEEEEKEEKEAEAQDGEPEGDSGSVEDLESREDAPAETSDMTKRDLPEDSEGTMDQDFPENMEDFVTLDELVEDDEDHTEQSDSLDHSRKGGMRVVNLVGFRRGYGFLGELLALAKPFGDVVKHLVLDLRPEAYLQFASEEEAKAMARFYNANVTATVCGLPVRISHSQTYPTIQSGPRKVVYVGQLPNTKYTDQDVLKLAESFGSVRKYFLNRIRRECFIEMENAEDAEKMANFYKKNPPKMQNKPLCVYVSRKYKHLKYGHRQPGVKKPAKRQSPNPSTTTSAKTSKNTEEPPSKKPKEEKASEEGKKEKVVEEEEKEKKNEQVVVKEEVEEKKDEKMEVTSTEVSAEPTQPQASVEPSTLSSEEAKESPDHQKTEDVMREEVDREAEDPAAPAGKASQAESSLAEPPAPTEPKVPTEPKAPSASLPLAPYDPENPVGVEYVKMGYYCRVCFLFYSNEDKAKKVHCSSQAHYDKLKKHLEKEQTKASSTKKRKHE